ncbi:MAG: N-6 DNA methylase, partial [Bacteroidales bacterium]|nr:N-6 DNA methylase [Bacteroidales bacterium]
MNAKTVIPKKILEKYVENTNVFNTLVVTSFIRNNNITVYNEFLSSFIIQDESTFGLDLFHFSGVRTLEDVINLFELAIPKKNSITNGAVYTPKYIREYIIDEVLNRYSGEIRQATIADISCGCGAFLISVADRLVDRYGRSYTQAYSQITGIDIDAESITRAKILISLQAAYKHQTIDVNELKLFVANTLDFDFNNNRFNIIVGNPPYVRSKNIDEESKLLMTKFEVCKSGNSDLYIPFFQIGMSLLAANGILGFITVNTFLKSVNARSLRELFSEGNYSITIANFGEELIFKGKLAYTCLFFAENKQSTELAYSRISSNIVKLKGDISYNNIPFKELDARKGWNLSDTTIMEAINRIETAGVPLGKAFNIKNGIATLANDIFIFQPHSEDETYYFLKFEGGMQKIEKSICRDIVKPNILKSESELDSKIEKVIFPYNGDGVLLSENEFIS